MRMITLMAMATVSLAAAMPALAQDAMMKDSMKSGAMKMSAADTKAMKTCKAMSHTRMMKDARCKRLMKMHPEMMQKDAMMKK